MGMRFHRSVKICKGVRINFSKSGTSLSVGGHGHTVNFSKRGTRETFGIPGTGLSYSHMVGTGSGRRSTSYSRSSSSSRSQVRVPSNATIHMNEKGQVWIADNNGREITDPSVLRKIKSTQQYKEQKARLELEKARRNDEIVRESNEENDKFINLYKLSSVVDSKEDFVNYYMALKPETFTKAEYSVPMPTEQTVRTQLEDEAKENVKGSIFKVGTLRKEYVEQNLPPRLADAVSTWRDNKDRFDAEQETMKEQADSDNQADYEKRKKLMLDLINGEDYAISQAFDSWIGHCQLPVEIDIDYDWNQKSGTMMLDVDLPEIEDIKDTKYTYTQSGNLKEKKKTQTELREEYSVLVLGLAIFITTHTFNISPAISRVVISGYTQRRNKAGDINDDYIYSIKFDRDMFEGRDVSYTSPKELCLKAENRINMTSTSLFKVIKPFEIEKETED